MDPSSPEFKKELRQRLTPLQFSVTQEKGTERAFSNKYYKLKDPGMYQCVACGRDLFSSSTKYDSGSGWPSFFDVVDSSYVTLKQDASHVGANLLLLIANPNLVRTEVSCTNCKSHLGHLFSDGPPPSRKRYCINSSSLNFVPAAEQPSHLPTESFSFPAAQECGPLRCVASCSKKLNGAV